MSQGIDVVSTWTPLALRGNTVISAVFNHTDTAVTDNDKGLLDARRLAEYAYARPRTRWNAGVTQRLGRASLLGRLSYYSGWYDYDSGRGTVFDPAGGLEQGFFDGRPIVDLALSVPLGQGTTLAVGGQKRLRHLLAGVGHRQCLRRAVQRVHAVGLQRRLLLRAHRLRLEQLSRYPTPPRLSGTCAASPTSSRRTSI